MLDISTIPIVYLWVDGLDPEYRVRHNITNVTSRNRDNNDLLYSLRSLEKNLTWWKGPIYLVTDKQVPKWLNTEFSRLRVVDHTEIIPAKYLPTRVSNTIEWFLHLIPGINDYFIAMNDDFMFLKQCDPTVFFGPNNTPKLSFNNNELINTIDSPAKFKLQGKVWLSTVHRSINILEEKLNYKFINKRYIQHSPRIFSKKAIIELHKLLKSEIDTSCMLRERAADGLLDTVYLIQYYMAYYLKLGIKQKDAAEYYKDIDNNTNVIQLVGDIKKSNCQFLCLNDNFSESSKSDELKTIYNCLFQDRSAFEVAAVQATPVGSSKYTFVSFYSEGAPNDNGYNLSHYENLVKSLLGGKCNYDFYTPKMLRNMGYEYAVKEYDSLGCVTGNKTAHKLGFYAWKPLILWLALSKLKDGEILIFHDLNIDKYRAYNNNFKILIESAEDCLRMCKHDFFVSREDLYKNTFHHCKTLTIKELGQDHPYFYNFPQVIVNIMFFRKSQTTMNMLKEWMDACKVERWLAGSPNDSPHQGFIHHCPEQGILCVLLAKWIKEGKYNIPLNYPNVTFSHRQLNTRHLVDPADCKYLEYLFNYDKVTQIEKMPNINCCRFVSFISEGGGFDKGIDFRAVFDKVWGQLWGKFPITFYKPRMIRELGYDYAVKEYDINEKNKCGYNRNAEYLGLYAWKPLILLIELQKMSDGDILIYHDSDIYKYPDYLTKNINRDIVIRAKTALEQSRFDVAIGRYSVTNNPMEENRLKHICKKHTIEYITKNYKAVCNFPRINSNIIFIKKSKVSMELVEEWNKLCKIPELISQYPNHNSVPEYRWHNNETAILNALIAKWVLERKNDISIFYPSIHYNNNDLNQIWGIHQNLYDYLDDMKKSL